MQIDFHHTVTYVVSRLAGFEHAQANTIAYAAQYVDDSTTTGFIQFDNDMRYQRHATAHPVLDPGNVGSNDDNSLSWLPFHFLPGNDSKAANEPPTRPYAERLICRPDSHVARVMMAAVIRTKNQPWGLHRLGIAAHVFADTFAHKGFVGLFHPLNQVADNIATDGGQSLTRMLVPHMGHGQVNTYPDRPYLRWSYTNALNQRVPRNNTEDFALAVARLYEEFKRYQAGDPAAAVAPIPSADLDRIRQMFETNTSGDETVRHKRWLDAIKADQFGISSADLQYDGSGKGGWKHEALGDDYIGLIEKAKASVVGAVKGKIEALADKMGMEVSMTYPFSEKFLRSDYKMFHDAARWHSHEIFADILPSFGIHAA